MLDELTIINVQLYWTADSNKESFSQIDKTPLRERTLILVSSREIKLPLIA